MEAVKKVIEEKLSKKVVNSFEREFDIVEDGLYLVEISARARSEKQIGPKQTDDDDLRIEIDGRKFTQPQNSHKYFDSPAAFSGGKLHNLKKIVFFLVYFSQGKHTITFIPDRKPWIEDVSVQLAGNKLSRVDLDLNEQAEDGDRRPWITFVLVDLPLKFLQATISTKWRFWDGDDVKLIIDGEIQQNPKSLFHKSWLWASSVIRTLFNRALQTKILTLNLPSGLHYIEFWADRMPNLESIKLELGAVDKFPSGEIAIYEDIVPQTPKVNLRSEPNESSEIITEILNGTKVFILESEIQGSKPPGFLSDIWHKILYGSKEGFIHSSLIEIEGQERERIVALIRAKAEKLGIDEKLALNLAHCESNWLPFAHSGTNNRGIYQLGESTIEEINKKHGGNVVDPYNVGQNIDGGLKYFRYLLGKYEGSQDSLRKVITAWSRGPDRVPYGGPFVFKKQSEGAQILLKCVLKEKRGEKYLKILGLFLLISLIGFGATFLGGNRNEDTKYPQNERSIFLSDEYTASLIDEARKGEVILTEFEDDFDGDGVFEAVEFGFISPEAFHYTTIVHPPNGEAIDIYGSFSKARTIDLNNDGIKELILRVKSGKEFSFHLFAYEKGALRLLPTYNNLPDPYEGIWAVAPLEMVDVNNDHIFELVSRAATSLSGNWRDWYHVMEYYRWNGEGFELYDLENNYFVKEVPRG